MSAADEQRLRELFEEYHRQVYAYCRRRLDAESARECASETFLIAWKKLDHVPEGERALRWLYAVARRVLANRYRSRRRSNRLTLRLGGLAADPPPGPETVALQHSEDLEVMEALKRLRVSDQEVLRLAVWEELPHAQIGEVLGCSAHAVDQRIRRARDRLASEMGRTGHRPSLSATPDSLRGEGRT